MGLVNVPPQFGSLSIDLSSWNPFRSSVAVLLLFLWVYKITS